MKLIKLPNGEFIRDENIIAIKLGDENLPNFPARIIIEYLCGDYRSIVLGYENNKIRNEIAQRIANQTGLPIVKV